MTRWEGWDGDPEFAHGEPEDLYCPGCGCDWPGCGCQQDMNTWTLRACPCEREWWDQHGERRKYCPHCGAGPAEHWTVREALYPPAGVPS